MEGFGSDSVEVQPMVSLPRFYEQPLPRGLSHHAPLMVPSLLALLGCTYPAFMLDLFVCAGALTAAATVSVTVVRAVATAGWTTLLRRRSVGARDERGERLGPFRVDRIQAGLRRRSRAAALPLLFLLLGIVRGYWWESRARAAELLSTAGKVEVTLVALDEPELSGYGSAARFRAFMLPSGTGGRGRPWLGVQAEVYPRELHAFRPGVPVACLASFSLPNPAMNPGGFDYKNYLLGERVFACAEVEALSAAEPKSISPLASAAIKWNWLAKTCIGHALDSTFPPEDSAILRGVFLGDRGGLTPEESQDFKRAGFYRYIAICGFHIDILTRLVHYVVRRLTKRPSFSRIAAITASFCYSSLSGWSPGVIRAFVSGTMRLIAPAFRRRYHPLAALGASVLVVAWAVPRPLTNTGFALSFAGAGGAWLGGIYGEAVYRHLASGDSGIEVPDVSPDGRRIIAQAASSLVRAATMSLVLFPVMARAFTEVSPWAFTLSGVWGAVAALTVPLAALAALFPAVGAVVGWAPHIVLAGVRTLSRAASRFPLASLPVPIPHPAAIAAFWALLLVPLASGSILGAARVGEDVSEFFSRRRVLGASRRLALAAAPLVLFCAAASRVFAPWPEVTFLYVSQGDCAIVRRGSSVMVVDTGTGPAFESHVLPYLRAKGIRQVDLCVISHLHEDHSGGLEEMCSQLSVQCVAVPPPFGNEVLAALSGLSGADRIAGGDRGSGAGGSPPRAAGTERHIPSVIELHPGLRYEWAGARIDVILPASGTYRTDEPTNESSLAFVLDLGGFSVEFWGDAPAPSISTALSRYYGDGEASRPVVVKVPHHGSADAYDAALYKRGNGNSPLYSVVSVGPNSYGHPSTTVVEAAGEGGALLRTDMNGAVTVRHLFGKTSVETFVPAPGRRTGLLGRSLFTSHWPSFLGGPE